jgi:integrase
MEVTKWLKPSITDHCRSRSRRDDDDRRKREQPLKLDDHFFGCKFGIRLGAGIVRRHEAFDGAAPDIKAREPNRGYTHPILGDELRWLRRLQRQQEPELPFVFTSERGSPFTTACFARMVERAGAEPGFGFKVHPHMLRHACGFALASKGHDTWALQAYLGHKNIQHTVRYTELSPGRFKDFWRD